MIILYIKYDTGDICFCITYNNYQQSLIFKFKDWALGLATKKFWNSSIISQSPEILSLQWLDISEGTGIQSFVYRILSTVRNYCKCIRHYTRRTENLVKISDCQDTVRHNGKTMPIN